MSPAKPPGLILAVRATARGFGWVLFESGTVPVDWGVAAAKSDRSAQSMKRFEKLLNQYQPSTVILEKPDSQAPSRNGRVALLADTMSGFASNRDMDTPMYSRAEVAAAVTGDPKARRHKVACAIAERLPILRHHLPPKRKLWEPEHGRQCLFDAAALGVAHHALTQPRP